MRRRSKRRSLRAHCQAWSGQAKKVRSKAFTLSRILPWKGNGEMKGLLPVVLRAVLALVLLQTRAAAPVPNDEHQSTDRDALSEAGAPRLAPGDWVKALNDLSYEAGTVRAGAFGKILAINSTNPRELVVDWAAGGARAALCQEGVRERDVRRTRWSERIGLISGNVFRFRSTRSPPPDSPSGSDATNQTLPELLELAAGDWVKATQDISYGAAGVVRAGSLGTVGQTAQGGLVVDWAQGGSPDTLSNCELDCRFTQRADDPRVLQEVARCRACQHVPPLSHGLPSPLGLREALQHVGSVDEQEVAALVSAGLTAGA